jgi:transcriptional regulator with XRE-family HTH domain
MAQASGATFAELAHRILVHERGWSLQEVAEKMGMKYHTLYARLRGRVSFTPEEVRALLMIVPDARLANFLLENTPFIAVDRALVDSKSDVDVHRGATKSVLEVSDVLRAVEAGLVDQKIDHVDRARIVQEINEAERALAALRARLTPTQGS